MAGTGLGLFLPSETAYKDPGRFRDVLMAEGAKEASYLASMDQFFAQLEESQRQFDVTTEQRQEFFEEELAWEREKSAEELAFQYWAKEEDVELGERQLGVQRYGIEAQERVGMAGVEAGRERAGMEFELGTRELEMTAGVNEFYRSLYRGEETRRQETHEVAREGISALNVPRVDYGGDVYGDVYGSRDAAGAISFSNVPTRDEGSPDWYNPSDWEDTLW